MNDRDKKYNAFVNSDYDKNNGRLVNCCEELDLLIKRPDLNAIFSQHYLTEILTYATNFSNFYKKYKNFKSLKDFPIVDKIFLKEHWQEITISEFNTDPNIKTKYTSGSTGTPFRMIMDKYKHSRWIAGNKVFRNNVGVKSHEKTLFISETVADKNIPIERQIQDNVFYISCRYLDEESLINLINKMMTEEVKSLTCMASFLEKMARLIETRNIPKWNGNMIAIFSVSETLKNNVRKIISKYFKCPVYVLYANEENGVLAVEDGSEYGCRANTADFFLEVLDMNKDIPAKDGEVGRLVITDFFNKAFPIIRYENGDLVTKITLPDGRIYIKDIYGRKVDALYTTDGRVVNYFNSISFLEPYTDIKQFQLIQHDYQHFTWKLNTSNHTYEKTIIEYCKKLFGKDSEWKFEYVNEIPKLRSGKFRMTVCEIKTKNERNDINKE